MTQAKGVLAQVLLDWEDTYNTDPTTPDGRIMPFNTFSVKADRNMTTPQTIRGIRSPAQPIHGNLKVAGPAVVPVDQIAFGFWLKALLGAPTSTQQAAKSINNGEAAVDVGGGVVGIPVTGHGFDVGEAVTIAATVNYNGSYTVLSSSTANQVNITATYSAETFGADDTIRATLYDHVFVVGSSVPSMVLDLGFTDITQYFKHNGCKLNSMGFEVGGDGEFVANLDIVGSNETVGAAALDATPTTLTFSRFQQFQATIEEGGSSIAYVSKVTLNALNNLDTSEDQFVIGNSGIRGELPEGIMGINGSIRALFQDLTLYNKAVNTTESSLKITYTSGTPNGNRTLVIEINELHYKRGGPPVETQGGIRIELPFEAFWEDDAEESVVKVTLTNNFASYA